MKLPLLLPLYTTHIKRLAPLLIVVMSVVVAIGAYLQALNSPFYSDDNQYIASNAKLAGLHLVDSWRLFVEPYNQMEFLPLRDLSYWLDVSLFGMTPSAFRLHNILLYAICCLLVYSTTSNLWRYFRPEEKAQAPWFAATVTALFALHPAHVEAVVWISSRKDLLSGMFAMLALWFAVNAKREHGLAPWYAGGALAAMVAAMLSKATMVVVAPAIAILWIIFLRDSRLSFHRRALLLWLLACLVLATCVFMVFTAHSSVIRLPVYFGIEAYPRTLAIMGWMARLAMSPESRHSFYPVVEDSWFWGMVVLGVAVVLAGVAGTVITLRKRSLEGFSLVVFTLLCLPYTQVLPYFTDSLVADRFLFLAVWPVSLLLVAMAWRLKTLPRAILLLIIVLPWVFQTLERPNDWKSFETLINADVQKYPGHYLPAARKIMWSKDVDGMSPETDKIANGITDTAIRNLVIKLIQAHRMVNNASAHNLQETMECLNGLTSDINKTPAQVKWNPPINAPYHESKEVLELEWLTLIGKFPDDASVLYNAGLSLVGVGKFENAAIILKKVTASPQLPANERGNAFKNLGIALINSGHIAAAEVPLLSALEQVPPDTEAYCVLAEVYRHTNQLGKMAQVETECHSRINKANHGVR